jgi:LacI family transcriptional regulator
MKARAQSSTKTKRPGIREIAEKLGVSIGTVDRALHNRPGISALSRKRVESMAKALGYQPNLAARFLSSRKQITIAVNIPREIAFFFDRVRDGLFGQREVEILEETLSEKIDGLVIAPGYPEKLRPVIRRAARRGIPVVCVGTDAPGSERLTSVSEDPYLSGCVVGELIGRFLPPGSRAMVVTGILATLDHAEKVRGFRDNFGSFCHNGELVGVIEAQDDEAQAYDKTWAALKQHPDLAGIYVTTANSLPVMRALEELGVAGKIVVITTDLFPELVPLIQSGKIVATMDEQPREQGRLAFQSMYRFLVEDVCPPPAIRLASHVVMKSNLKSFL